MGTLNTNYNNSFSGINRTMAFPLRPKLYFGFPTKELYTYNVKRQLSNLGPGIGAFTGRWERKQSVNI